MVYSTCTFNRFENDLNVDWICSELGGSRLASRALVPGFVPGEGQYCATVLKDGACSGAEQKKPRVQKADPSLKELGRLFRIPMDFRRRGDTVVAVPSVISDLVDHVTSFIPAIATGCAVGVMKGADLVPDEDLALSIALARGEFEEAGVDRQTALAFLHKDAVLLPDAPRGMVMLTYKNVPLGFVKNLGNRTNNLHPQARRIRMDIK